MSRYHAIATRYDSGFTVDYTCDSCGERQRSTGTPSGWAENGKSHSCPDCAAGPSDSFRGMTVQQGAEAVMAALSVDDLEYASDPARGEYRGFAALHDRMDANMILPFADDVDVDDDGENDRYLRWCNPVMDEVTRRIISR